MTNADYKALLASCNFRDPDQVSKLVTSSHTQIRFNKKVQERQLKNPAGASNYFTGFFGTEVWPDGQGQTLEREFYTDPYLPVTFSHFVKTMQVCDPNLANECHTDYCDIPEGGRGSLGPPVMYKAGFKTPRDCIANIRHIDSFYYWARKAVAGREKVDEQVTNLFGTFAVLRTLGHKVVLQGAVNANGEIDPVPNSNPRNPFGMFNYSYMEELFPRASNLETIVPLTVDILQILARRWTQFPEANSVAVGPRGELIFEMWYPDDWYQDAVIHNPDYMEKLKIMMPSKLFGGYSLAPTGREVIENWAMRSMPWLPRFTESTEGGLIMVDTHEAVDIEVGKEWIGGREFLNAPFGLAVMPSPDQGNFLTRPALTQSGAGLPIMPITGDGNWVIRNDYDKECNADLNQPYSQKRFEMGFIMNSPAGLGIIYRRRKMRLQAINTCDFMPIFQKVPNTVDCPLTTVGCEDNKRRASDNIMEENAYTYVECSAGICGNTEVAPFIYWLKIERHAGDVPDRNFIGCECGAAVFLAIHDEDGVFLRQANGTLVDNRMRWPYDYYWVSTDEELADGECIKGVACADATPTVGNVIDCWDNTVPGHEGLAANTVVFFLDAPIDALDTDTLKIEYFDENGVELAGEVAAADIVDANQSLNQYTVTSPGLTCAGPAGTVSTKVTVN